MRGENAVEIRGHNSSVFGSLHASARGVLHTGSICTSGLLGALKVGIDCPVSCFTCFTTDCDFHMYTSGRKSIATIIRIRW